MAEGIMIMGGSSSGKSQYAEEIAESAGENLGFPIIYLATARVVDEEFAGRVERHRQRRPAAWNTIEEQLDLARVLRSIGDKPVICLVDGVGTWISNMMIESLGAEGVWDARKQINCLSKVYDFIEALKEIDGLIIMVADEVGWDLVPEYELGRIFIDLNGLANQILAAAVGEVFLVLSGTPICLKGGTIK